MTEIATRNIGLELVRVTEATALAAGRWMGLGNREMTHRAATEAMSLALDAIDIDGHIVIGEEDRIQEATPLDTGSQVGTGQGPEVDVVVDPIDGTQSVITGHPGAVSVVCVAPRGSMWDCKPAAYLDKIIVDGEAAHALVPECIDAPAGWTLAVIARAKGKSIRDLQVIVLNRPRHKNLIEEIRKAGARILLRPDGDTAGALITATTGTGADVLMGIGGAPEGVSAACGVKAIGGAMLARIAPQSEKEWDAVKAAGLDTSRILTCDELVSSSRIFLAATGVTNGPLLRGVEYWGRQAKTYSLVLRGETGTRRTIYAEHRVSFEA